MKTFFQKYATPLITGLFLISLVSGVALFFHFGSQTFRGMHEWLSMVLILPFGLHIWKNWRPFVNYFRRSPMAIALVASLAAALTFALWPSDGAGGPPQFAFAHTIAGNSLEKVAPLLGETPDSLVARLQKAGFTATTPQATLTDIATKSGRSEAELFVAIRAAAQ